MRLRRNAIYAVMEVVASGVALFLIYRNVVQVLGVSSLGIWSLVLATTAFGRVADIGISAGLARFVARAIAEDEPYKAIAYMRTGAITVAATMGLVALLGWYPLWLALGWSLKGHELDQAREVLPWAILTFWLLNLKAVGDASLLGLQRVDLRLISSIVGTATQVCASLALVKPFGLVGLAWAQAGQYIPVLGLVMFFLWRMRPATPKSSLGVWFSWPIFRELFGFGAKLQVGTVANLMFEPACKIVLGNMAGTAVLGTFEMAYRMIYQVRSIAIMAIQTTVPAFAELDARKSEKLPELFEKVCRVAALATAPLMIMSIVASPFISSIWIGSINPHFVFLSAALAIGWSINVLSSPAYFLGIADGRVWPNIVGQILSGILAPIAVYILGVTSGGLVAALGVAFGKIPGDLLPAFMIRPLGSWRHSAVFNKYCIFAFLSVTVVGLGAMGFSWREI
jgi:O-antigen/teichoic acid export membrane protein